MRNFLLIIVLLAVSLNLLQSKILYEDESFTLQYQQVLYDDGLIEFSLSFDQERHQNGMMQMKFGKEISPMDQIRLNWDFNNDNYSLYDEFSPYGLFYKRARLDRQQDLQNLRVSKVDGFLEISFQRQMRTSDRKQDLDLNDGPLIFQIQFLTPEGSLLASKMFVRDLSTPDFSPRMLTVTGDVSPLSSYIEVFSHKLYWSIDSVNSEITFLLETDLSGYVGIGFDKGMDNVDMAIVQCYSGTVVQDIDYFSYSKDTPAKDSSQDITILGSEVSSGNLQKLKFSRSLTSSDSSQDQTIVPDATVIWAFAEYSGNFLGEHSRYVNLKFNLCSGCTGLQASTIVNDDGVLALHRYLLLIGWGVWVDLLVIFAQYLKHKNFYIEVHGYMAFFLDVGSILTIALLLDRSSSVEDTNAQAHSVIGIIFLILVCVHHLGGVFIKFQLQFDDSDRKNAKDLTHLVKKGHLFSGFILYVLGKVQLFTGIANYQKLDPGSTATFMIIYQVIVIALIKLAPDIIYRLSRKKIGRIDVDQQLPNKKGIYQKIIEMIQSGADRYQILETYPEARYVIYLNAVYEIENFNHSGGKYILDQVLGREIDCFMYGGYALESSSLAPQTHTQYAGQVLTERFQGHIEIPESENVFLRSDSKKIASEFRLMKKQKLSHSIGIFYLQSEGKQVKNQIPGVRWFGRHFTIWDARQSNPKWRMYTTALCMTESNQEQQKQLVAFAENGFKDQLPSSNLTASDSLPLIIKKYEKSDAFSFKIHNSYEAQGLYYLEGPHGLGLQLSEQSQGLFVIFVGGTGVLPFLDLFYHLFKLAISRILEKQNKDASQILKKSETFANPIKFLVYGAFQQQEDIVGLDFIDCLNNLNKIHNLDLVEFRFKVSKPPQDNKVRSIVSLTKPFNKEFLESQSSNQWNNLSKIYICGPPAMNKSVQEGLISLNLKNKIHFI